MQRVRLYAGLLLAIGIAYWAAILLGGHEPFDATGNVMGQDFIAKAAGGRIALQGSWHGLYEISAQRTVELHLLGARSNGSPFYWDGFVAPPFAAFLFAPFAALPYLVGAALWTIFSAFLITASLWLLWPLAPSLHRYGRRTLVVLAFSSFPVVELLINGQDAAVCLFLFSLGLRLMLARRDGAAGAVLGLGMFKPQYFLLVPVLLLLQRRWRALGAWAAVAAALTVASLALVGPDGARDYVRLLTREFSHDGVGAGRAWNAPSLIGLARVMRAYLPSPLGAAAAAATFGIGGVVVVQWFARSKIISRTDRELALLYASMVLVGALTSSHLFYYDAVILWVPVLVLYEAGSSSATVRILLATVYLLSWSYIILDQPVLAQPLFVRLPAPLPLVSAPWVVVPLVGLFEVAQRLLGTRATPAPPFASIDLAGGVDMVAGDE